ncbi:diguanylate cyclase (GGDEF)-like protein [Sphingomonas zeicaulis]|uniref:putative bifunctional diguanylate cyclase/phosphodiesterase n=1 Tax=Sphingomonas zeicaulis TaxID=1632740 RepID=UPI003D1DCBF3
MLRLQNIILEMVARGDPLEVTAGRLCTEIEALLPDIATSVVTVDASGRLHPLAHGLLSENVATLVDGVAIGPEIGACGSAIFHRRAITSADIANDPAWIGYRDTVLAEGFQSCWSSPILDGRGAALGAFGFYYRTRRGPTPTEEEVVATCAQLLAIAIERHRRTSPAASETIDPLTGLGSRAAFDRALAALASEGAAPWALLLIDLDGFRRVNDSLGHGVGDAVIRLVGSRIAAAVTPDSAFRTGGDSFAVIAHESDALGDPASLSIRIATAIGEPIELSGETILIGATIGFAISDPAKSPDILFEHATHALHHAKQSRRGGHLAYSPSLGNAVASHPDALHDLERALHEDRIDAYYQPVVDLETWAVASFEALCRLTTPTGEVLPAAAFHQAMSHPRIAPELTRRMLKIVAGDIAHWMRLGIADPQISINVGSADIHGGGLLERTLSDTFEHARVPLGHLVVEVTETVHMDRRADAVRRVLEGLQSRGLRIALDDFGTGYASLTHLLSVPVDIIKIDRSFVHQLGTDAGSAAIVQGLIAIADGLKLRVVAEGIETEAQRRLLQRYGCKYGQGFLFSRALDRRQATRLLQGEMLPLAIAIDGKGETQPRAV